MGRRRELRLHLLLTVRLWGTDIAGRCFEQDVTTLDLTATGVHLGGVCHPVAPGSILHMQYRDSKARFCVRWVGKGKSEGHIGLELLEGEKFDWGRTIPFIPGDAFTRKLIDEDADFGYLK